MTQTSSILAGLIGPGIQASRTPAMHEHEGDAQGIRTLYRLIDLDQLGLDTQGAPSTKQKKSWVDPIVGVRLGLYFSQNVFLLLSGDVGGFGVGMDLQWQAKLDIGFRASESLTIWLGYRALNQDFDDAGDQGRFAMDATYQGPELGATFSF